MVAIATLLVIVTLTLVVNRVGTIALTTTGLSTEVAHFQARSALTGVGFTTSETELVVNHPVRALQPCSGDRSDHPAFFLVKARSGTEALNPTILHTPGRGGSILL